MFRFADREDSSPMAGLIIQSGPVGEPFLLMGASDRGGGGSRCSCLAFENRERTPAVIFIAIVIAVGEVCPDFTQVACSDRLIARHTERLSAWRPFLYQYKSHVAPPNAKQSTVSVA
jgi:hypothetical protein